METIVSQKNKNELAGAYLELLDEMKEIKKQVSKNLNNSPKTQDIEQYGNILFTDSVFKSTPEGHGINVFRARNSKD